MIEDIDDLHNRIVPRQEPRRGAYGTTSLTSDQVLEILGKWRPPEMHWTDYVLMIVLIPLNIWFVWHFIPVFAVIDKIDSIGGFLSFFASIFTIVFFLPLAFTAHFVPAMLACMWLNEARQKKWISAKRKQNITAWERELDAVLRYERDFALYQQAYTEQGRDYWLNSKGLELEDKLQKMLNRLGADMKSTAISGDGGVDLRGNFRGEMTLIQCKGLAKNCGVAVIRDAAGVKSISGSHMVVCCPKGFSKGAINYASTANIELWDVDDLVQIALG